MVLVIIGAILAALTWLIRMLVDHRCWSRLSHVQTDLHNKLLDRFSSNEELLAYIQTPAGKRILDSVLIAMEAERSLVAPISRILWSVQIGLVLSVGGIGVKMVSLGLSFDAVQLLAALGVIALSVGIGFVVLAVASHIL